MRELWPNPTEDLDVAKRLAGDERGTVGQRPWVMMTMISSLDGGLTVDGLSGGLGNEDDLARFIAVRRLVDAIVVGAGTVRAENYQPTTVPIHVVSGRLNLDRELRIFDDPERPPVIHTTAQAAATKGQEYVGIAEVVDLGDSITPESIVADLGDRGATIVGLEGGGHLNGQFLAADLVDEIVLTISPLAIGGDAARIASGAPIEPRRFALDRLSIGDDLIFARYLRRR